MKRWLPAIAEFLIACPGLIIWGTRFFRIWVLKREYEFRKTLENDEDEITEKILATDAPRPVLQGWLDRVRRTRSQLDRWESDRAARSSAEHSDIPEGGDGEHPGGTGDIPRAEPIP